MERKIEEVARAFTSQRQELSRFTEDKKALETAFKNETIGDVSYPSACLLELKGRPRMSTLTSHRQHGEPPYTRKEDRDTKEGKRRKDYKKGESAH